MYMVSKRDICKRYQVLVQIIIRLDLFKMHNMPRRFAGSRQTLALLVSGASVLPARLRAQVRVQVHLILKVLLPRDLIKVLRAGARRELDAARTRADYDDTCDAVLR